MRTKGFKANDLTNLRHLDGDEFGATAFEPRQAIVTNDLR